ncbi:hypothetical protein LX36DRAFT_682201 [Colletotrichum falcatum]|nr:hypothetical protein LX36DRAFT_682201 [Colletotrichum falcatum]
MKSMRRMRSRSGKTTLMSVLSRPRSDSGGLYKADVRLTTTTMTIEVDLRQPAAIHDWLWIVGRPMPPRALHQQHLLNREIAITKKIDLHLVCSGRRGRALGFLFLYTALIVHKSDFLLLKTLLRGYLSRWNQYGFSTVYIAVMLTATQISPATEVLQGNQAFQLASHGFTIFSIVGPLAAAGLVVIVFCYIIRYGWTTLTR